VFSIYEKHVCFSVLKENRSANTDPSSGIGGASIEAKKVDTIPKPDGLAEAAATANPNRNRTRNAQSPDGVRAC
jgi:hypothetical protein